MEICQSPEHLKYIELKDKSRPQTPKEKKNVAINGEEEERIEDDPYGDEAGSASGHSYGGYGSYGSSGSSSSDDDGYGDESSEDEDDDREYNGDMFEHGSAELTIVESGPKGQLNKKYKSYDKTVLSIYNIGGSDQHYTRLRDVIIDFCPVMSDLRFYISHEANAAYFLARENEKQYLIVVHLGSLKWKKYDITHVGKLRNLKSASLIKGNTMLVVLDPTYAKRARDAKKKKSGEHIHKEWLFFNLKTGEKEWTIPSAEAVFFKGASHDDEDKRYGLDCDFDQEED